jgi:hypothetical protein
MPLRLTSEPGPGRPPDMPRIGSADSWGRGLGHKDSDACRDRARDEEPAKARSSCDDSDVPDDAPTATVSVNNSEGQAALFILSLLGVFIGLALLIAGSGALVAACLFLVPSVIGVIKAPRMGLVVTSDEVIVRNFGRTHRIPRDEVAGVAVSHGSNITGLTSVLLIHRHHGKPIEAAGTASYSEAKVEAMRARVSELFPY